MKTARKLPMAKRQLKLSTARRAYNTYIYVIIIIIIIIILAENIVFVDL